MFLEKRRKSGKRTKRINTIPLAVLSAAPNTTANGLGKEDSIQPPSHAPPGHRKDTVILGGA